MSTPRFNASVFHSVLRSLPLVAALSSTALVGCSSSEDAAPGDPPGTCNPVGKWTETEIAFEGEEGTFCEQLVTSLQKPDLTFYTVTKNDTTYSYANADGKFGGAWAPNPDACSLTTKGIPSKGTFTIDGKDVTVTFTPDGESVVAIDGSNATVTQTSKVSAKPVIDGTPCNFTQRTSMKKG